MAQLTLSFLDTFQVTVGDALITKFRSANVQGLLVYLALHPGRALSRDVLAALFWPDEPDSTARTNFRQTLYQLRKLLEKGDDGERPFFIVTRQTVQFNPDSDHQCDVIDFLQALKVGDLGTAVSLYSGDLLPGFTCDSLQFEDWQRRERERLHGLALDVLQQRTEWLLGSGDYAEAKAMCQQQLALESWRELAHRQLMQAYALAGDRQAALAQFATCQETLWQELAAEPEPETVSLAEQIAAGEEIQQRTQPRHNLIAPVTAYFGREADLTAVRAHITDRDYRLVTLVGEGGIGKSRLALEVAWQLRDQFADGVWFVPLAGLEVEPAGGSASELTTGRNLPQVEKLQDAIATAVSQAIDQPIAGQQSAKAQLLTFLRERQLLLVLDNFEPLLDGAPLVLDLLQQAPGVCVICTSREPLNFQAEWVLPLERLGLPPIADPFLNTTAVPQDLSTFPAVQLFVDRAQRANGRFQLTLENQSDIVTLCRLLSGLPLALELAAAALRQQTTTALISAIQASVDALAIRRRDIPPRHRSMRAVFDSSWGLLSEAEQAQLAGLSVFWGPFSVRAAEAVTQATFAELQILQEKSLLQADGDRFAFHSLLRQFAAEKLADFPQGETAVVRHSHYYLQAVADLGGALNGEMPHLAVQRIAGALENVRGAWGTAVARGDWDYLLAALVPLSDFYQIRGLYREGLRLFGTTADSLQEAEHLEGWAQMLTQQAAMYVRLSDYSQAIQIIEQALPFTANDWLIARLHITWGEALWRQGAFSSASDHLTLAMTVAQKISDEVLIGIAQFHLGVIDLFKGANEKAQNSLSESLSIWQRRQNRRWQGFTLISLGSVETRLGHFAEAKNLLMEALNINEGNRDQQGLILTLTNLGLLATEQKTFDQARKYFQKGLSLAEATGDLNNQALQVYNLAWSAKEAQEWSEAELYAQKALVILREVRDRRGEGLAFGLLGDVAVANGRLSLALENYQTALTISEQIGNEQMVDYVHHAINQLKGQSIKKEAN